MDSITWFLNLFRGGRGSSQAQAFVPAISGGMPAATHGALRPGLAREPAARNGFAAAPGTFARGLFAVLISAAVSISANEPAPLSTPTHAQEREKATIAPGATAAHLSLREVRYDGKLSDARARFIIDIDAESVGKGEASLPLFEGDVALLPARLPSGLRLLREGSQYHLVASRPGTYKLRLELVAKITRAEPWNQVSFIGPPAGIAAVTATAEGAGVELQLLSGTPLETESNEKSPLRGVLGADRTVALRWQSKAAEAARKTLITCDTIATAQVAPTVIRFITELRYDIVQGNLSKFAVLLPANHALTRVEGAQIRDWQVTTEAGPPFTRASASAVLRPPLSPPGEGRGQSEGENREGMLPASGVAGGSSVQLLTVELIKPVEKSYCLKLFSEQTVESTPFNAKLTLPQPQDVDRETGSLTVSAEDTVIEVESLAGLRQVNPPAGAFAAYRFYARPLMLAVNLRRIEPVINVASRVTARLEETRLVLLHALTLKVDKAGIYAIEVALPEAVPPLGNLIVTDVRGDGIEDWKSREGKLIVSFANRLLGEHKLDIYLEQAQKTFPDQIILSPLRVAAAVRQVAQIGVGSAPGISLKTAELNGLREISINQLPNRTDELLAYLADQAEWTLKLSSEKLAPRLIADIFNLVTIGDGLLGGSATIRYAIINQGVQEFRLRVPASWKNVDFTGPNIRRKEPAPPDAPGADTNSVIWSIALQEKAWGGYTLVVTYDEQFDPHKATLKLGGIHALEVERETGSVAVTGAANLQLRETSASEPIRRIDESELAPTDRALITRSVLLAYQYGSGVDYELAIETARFPEEKVLEAVADRTQLTTVVTEAGEMLTQATFMVKNNDKQFQKFILPPRAKFWSAYVNGQPAKAEADGVVLLVPLPRQANRDQAYAVEVVYAQKLDSLKSLAPREIALVAPQTDVQTSFAEWELYVPATHQLMRFDGNMSVAQGTTYGWRDAGTEFATAYRELWRNTKGLLAVLVLVGVIAAFVTAAIRRGWHGAMTALGLIAVCGVLAAMLLPALGKAKAKAQRISAINNLKQIGLAARIYSTDNGDRFPSSFDQMRNEIGTDKVLIDPVSGQPFVWAGAGKSDSEPSTIIAYSPVDLGGRAVLFADGSVVQLNTRQFEEAIQRSGAALGQSGVAQIPVPASTPASGQPHAPLFGAAVPGAGGGGGPVNGAAGVSAPSTQATLPTAQGLRSLRIDIPRTGQKFTFTKVLKLTPEPLTVAALAVTTKVLHTVRSALQVGVFVAGLLLLAWQLRRAAPRGLVVTLALAMIIASVGHLLLTTRLLGTALVIGVPMILITLAVLLARRYWPRRATSASVAGGAEPTQSPGGSPGMGPAVAAIAFMLAISSIEAKEPTAAPHSASRIPHPPITTTGEPPLTRPSATLSTPVEGRGQGEGWPLATHSALRTPPACAGEQSGAAGRHSALESLSILSASYTGTVHERVARIQAVIQVVSSKAGQTLPMFGEEVAIEEFSATPGTVRLLRQGNSIGARLPKAGEATLRVRFLVELGGDVTRRRLAFAIPPALSSRLFLTVDEPEAAVEFPAAVSYHSEASQQQTRVEAIVGAADRVELQWTPRVKRAAEIVATVFAQNASLVSFSGGAMNVRSLLDYQISQGELRELRVRLPAGHRLLRVEGDFIRTWQVKAGARTAPVPGAAGSDTLDTDAIFPNPANAPRAAAWPPSRRSGGKAAVRTAPILGAGGWICQQRSETYPISATWPRAAAWKAAVRRAPILGAMVFSGVARVPDSNSSAVPDAAEDRMPASQDEGDILLVELLKGVSPHYRLAVETERTIDTLPADFTVETPHALEVKRETGFVALNDSDELGLTIEQAHELKKGDGGDSLKVRGEKKPPVGAYQFLKPGYTLSVRVEPLQPQIEALVRNRVRIGAEQVQLDALVDYTIKRAGVFALRLAVPEGFRIEAVNGSEIAQWVERDDNGARVLEVNLKQRTLGSYSLRITLLMTHKQLPKTMEIVGAHPLQTVKLTGYVVVSSEVGVQARGASFDGLTEVPVSSVQSSAVVPVAHQGGASETPAAHFGTGLAYKYVSSEPVPATQPWKLLVATETIESWVRAEVVNRLTLTETLATGRALVRYEIQNAPIKEFRLKIPAAFKNVEITGTNLRRRDQTGEEWRIELQNKVVGQYLLTVTWDQPWSVKDQESLFDAAGVEAIGVERETGLLAVIARSPLQITPKAASAELIRVDVQDLPEWAGRAEASIVLVYRYLRPGYTLSLGARRFAQADVLQALVDQIRLTTVVADDGQMMTELALSVRNNGRQFLEVTLPRGAQVWSAFVAGQAVRPSIRDGKLLLPLERAAETALPAELIYVSAEKFPRTKGAVALASPAFDVPVKNARWELYLPPDYGYGRFDGTMTREPDAAPVVRTFSALEYREAETGKQRALEIAASSSRDEVRRKLAAGKLEEASKAYDRARRSGQDPETDEFKGLAKELREAQSSNLVRAQEQVIFNNSARFRKDGATPAQEPAVQIQLDDKSAQQQWERLQKAQQVASAAVRPLRVTLPARGLRHSFSQVLQTEVGKPMLVRFVAANEKAANWPLRIGCAVLAFVGLWALVTFALDQRTTLTKTARAAASICSTLLMA